MYKLKPLFIR